MNRRRPIAYAAMAALGTASCAVPKPRVVPPVAVVVTPAATAPPPPSGTLLVAPLRYDAIARSSQPARDDAALAAPPALPDLAAPVLGTVQSFQLSNGLRVLVLQRHAFPLVAATLSVSLTALGADDVGERRAQLLAATFLVPTENVGPASGFCTIDACIVQAKGTSLELEQVLHHIADRAMHESATHAEYERRWSAATESFDLVGAPVARNARALLFGKNHPYGGPRSGPSPSLADVEGFRRRAFVASASTLAVVGDVTVEAVRDVVARELGAWAAGAPPHSRPLAPMGPSENRIAMCRNGGSRQVAVGVVAVGPAPRSPDAPAFEVLAQMLGGGLDSELFHGVREGLGLAYTVGATVQWFAGASMITVGGSFDGADVFDGTRAILADIASLQGHEAMADRVARAKGTALAAWRVGVETNQGIADRLAMAAIGILPPDVPLHWPERLLAVTAADVQQAAQRYLAPPSLRIVFVGRPNFIGTAHSLGLGPPVITDFDGRRVDTP
jgi:zinc protease